MGWLSRSLVPFSLPLALGAIAYLTTVEPVISAARGDALDLRSLVRRSVGHAAEESYEVLFLGNSRVARGVNPAHIRRRAHNFAFDDDTFQYYLPKYEFVCAHGKKISVAFVGVDAFQLAYWNYDRYFVYREHLRSSALDEWAWDPSYAPALAWSSLDKKAKLRFSYRSALLSLAAHGRPTGDPSASAFVLERSGYYRVTYPGHTPLKTQAVHADVIDRRLLRELKRTVETLRRDGVEVVLFTPPASRPFSKFYAAERGAFEAAVQEVATSSGARFVSWQDAPGYADDDFPDETHLSIDAAARFSQALSDWIDANAGGHAKAD